MLDEAELEAWGAQMKAHFQANGGLTAEWTFPSGTSTTESRTPTGLLSPPPTKDLVVKEEAWTGPVTTVGFPSAIELTDRLKRLENEQRRAGTQFRLRFDSVLQKWRAVPDAGEETADPDASRIATSPLHHDYQHPLEASAESSHLQESRTPSPTTTAPKLRATKRQPDPDVPSSERKRRRISEEDATQGPSVINRDHAVPQAASTPVNKVPGRLARDIGQEVRRKSKTSGRDRKKQTVIQQVKAKQTCLATHPESEIAEQVSKCHTGKDKAKEVHGEIESKSLQQVEEASTAIEDDSISKTSRRQRAGPVRTKHKQATEQKSYSPYARTGRSAARSVNKELPLEPSCGLDGEPTASTSTTRTRKKASEQQQLENVGMDTSASHHNTTAPLPNTSYKPRTSKKTKKKTGEVPSRSPEARITRSQTKPSFPFVELDEYGEEINIPDPNLDTDQRKSLKMQRLQERKKKRYWKRLHQDAVERHNMQQVWREWFTEQGADYEQR